jgi:tRNA uridine 5-carbamoylmethylation protein Kti12
MSIGERPFVGLCLVCGAPGVGKSTILDQLSQLFPPACGLSIMRFDEVYQEVYVEFGQSPSSVLAAFSPLIWHAAQQRLHDRVVGELARLFRRAVTMNESSWVVVEDNFHLQSMRKRLKQLFLKTWQSFVSSDKSSVDTGLTEADSLQHFSPRGAMCEVLVAAPPALILSRNAARTAPIPDLVVHRVLSQIASDVTWQRAATLLHHGDDNRPSDAFLSITECPVSVMIVNDDTLDSSSLKLATFLGEISQRSCQELSELVPSEQVAQIDRASYDTIRHRIDLQLRSAVSTIMKSRVKGKPDGEHKMTTQFALNISSAKKQILESARLETAKCDGHSAHATDIWEGMNDTELYEMVFHLLSSAVEVV